jgi:transposase-like protein
MILSGREDRMPRRSPFWIKLSTEDRRALEQQARRYTSPYWEVVRARVVLLAADGLGNDEIAGRLDMPRQVVSKWRKRFFEEGRAGLADRPRGGRPAAFPPGGGRRGQGARLPAAR